MSDPCPKSKWSHQWVQRPSGDNGPPVYVCLNCGAKRKETLFVWRADQ